jgi:hypothetical protein
VKNKVIGGKFGKCLVNFANRGIAFGKFLVNPFKASIARKIPSFSILFPIWKIGKWKSANLEVKKETQAPLPTLPELLALFCFKSYKLIFQFSKKGIRGRVVV